MLIIAEFSIFNMEFGRSQMPNTFVLNEWANFVTEDCEAQGTWVRILWFVLADLCDLSQYFPGQEQSDFVNLSWNEEKEIIVVLSNLSNLLHFWGHFFPASSY